MTWRPFRVEASYGQTSCRENFFGGGIGGAYTYSSADYISCGEFTCQYPFETSSLIA